MAENGTWWVSMAAGLELEETNSRMLKCIDDFSSEWPSAIGGGGRVWENGVLEFRVRLQSRRLQNLYIGVAHPAHDLNSVCGETPLSRSYYPHDGDITHARYVEIYFLNQREGLSNLTNQNSKPCCGDGLNSMILVNASVFEITHRAGLLRLAI